ncbi:MAG: DUF262 domain-containing protein [Phycisphaerales bacterium JB043]
MKVPTLVTPALLFDQGNRYVAPVFQRYYVWDATQLDSLFNDIDQSIEDMDSDKKTFLGAIVLQDRGRQGPTEPHDFLIIDGQQRLTTIYLILSCFAKLDLEFDNGDRANIIMTRYLADGAPGPRLGKPKLIPTLQDRHSLWSYLKTHLASMEWNFETDRGDRSKGKCITPQLDRIERELKDRLLGTGDSWDSDYADLLLMAILEHLEFVNIQLDASDDANETFRKLNFEGTDLGIADLVRNDVFSRFNKPTDAKNFYTDKWVKFEEGFPDGELDKYFYPFAIIKFEGAATVSSAFPQLRSAWKDHKAKDVLADLKKYQQFYCSLCRRKQLSGLSAELNALVYRMSRMPRTRVVWPFIIQVLAAVRSGDLGDDLGVADCSIVESFMVRRALTGKEPTGLHAVFKVLWKKSGGDPGEVIDNIVSKTIEYPDDNQLKHSVTRDAVDTRTILPYVLQELEFSHRISIGSDPLSAEDIENQTIEHVLPQKLNVSWGGAFTQEQHEKLVGTIGNLVALSGKQNKSLKAKPWSDKRSRYAGSNWQTTQEVAKAGTWGPASIKKRTREMCDWILDRWPELDHFVP